MRHRESSALWGGGWCRPRSDGSRHLWSVHASRACQRCRVYADLTAGSAHVHVLPPWEALVSGGPPLAQRPGLAPTVQEGFSGPGTVHGEAHHIPEWVKCSFTPNLNPFP